MFCPSLSPHLNTTEQNAMGTVPFANLHKAYIITQSVAELVIIELVLVEMTSTIYFVLVSIFFLRLKALTTLCCGWIVIRKEKIFVLR